MLTRSVLLRSAALAGAAALLACTGSSPSAPDALEGAGARTPSDPGIVVTFADASTDRITSDGRGTYRHGECGVSATLNLGDVRLDPDAKKIRPQDAAVCGPTPRKVTVAFTERAAESPPASRDGSSAAANFFKVDEVEGVSEADGPVLRPAIVVSEGVCSQGLRFNPGLDARSSSVMVTRSADGSWTIATQPYPNNVAVCLDPTRSYYHMPMQLVVRLK